jgi:hypothetical protein
MQRYWRAFWTALKMTLRGERLHTPLQDWLQQTAQALATIDQIAQREAIDPAAVRLRIDRREISMATILQSVEFHRSQAYPRLLRETSHQAMNLIYAANMGDHFRLSRLEAALPDDSPIRQAVAALGTHLEAIPRPERG